MPNSSSYEQIRVPGSTPVVEPTHQRSRSYSTSIPKLGIALARLVGHDSLAIPNPYVSRERKRVGRADRHWGDWTAIALGAGNGQPGVPRLAKSRGYRRPRPTPAALPRHTAGFVL